jgi:hypothetical protein
VNEWTIRGVVLRSLWRVEVVLRNTRNICTGIHGEEMREIIRTL